MRMATAPDRRRMTLKAYQQLEVHEVGMGGTDGDYEVEDSINARYIVIGVRLHDGKHRYGDTE